MMIKRVYHEWLIFFPDISGGKMIEFVGNNQRIVGVIQLVPDNERPYLRVLVETETVIQ